MEAAASPPPTTVTPDGPTGSDEALTPPIGMPGAPAETDAAPPWVSPSAEPPSRDVAAGSESDRPIACPSAPADAAPTVGPPASPRSEAAVTSVLDADAPAPPAFNAEAPASGALGAGVRATSGEGVVRDVLPSDARPASTRGAAEVGQNDDSGDRAAGDSPARPFRNDTIEDTADGVEGETGAPLALAPRDAPPGAPKWPGTAGGVAEVLWVASDEAGRGLAGIDERATVPPPPVWPDGFEAGPPAAGAPADGDAPARGAGGADPCGASPRVPGTPARLATASAASVAARAMGLLGAPLTGGGAAEGAAGGVGRDVGRVAALGEGDASTPRSVADGPGWRTTTPGGATISPPPPPPPERDAATRGSDMLRATNGARGRRLVPPSSPRSLSRRSANILPERPVSALLSEAPPARSVVPLLWACAR